MEFKLLSLCAMMVIFGITSSDAELIAYPHVGCYEGWRIRRYYNHELGSFSGKEAIAKCYVEAKKEGYKSFAITDEGKCLSGEGAEKHYTSFDESNRCKDGLGSRNLFDIYLVAGGKRNCEGLADGEYQDTTFCNRFYTCTNGEATVQLCPDGLLFNPANRECRDAAPCPRGAPCMYAPDGEYIHPTSCRKYLVCHKGYAFEASCPAHLWFNTDTKQCENPDNVDCRHDPCMESPCLNGGECKTSSQEQRGYTCVCKTGFTGTRCEKEEPKPCNANPCKNGGACKDLDGDKYECTCKAGYGGKDCSEPILMKSKILQDHPDSSKTLEVYLRPVRASGKSWTLCYRGSENHFFSDSFHSHCNHHGPTVTLVQVGQYVFGAYTDKDWTSSAGYKYSTASFLFSLNNHMDHPFKSDAYQHQSYAIYDHSSYGPTFGSSHDLYVANQCNANTNSNSNLGSTYRAPFGYSYGSSQAQSAFAGSYNFRCDEYEVFYLA